MIQPITPPNAPVACEHLLDYDQDVFDGILWGVNQFLFEVKDDQIILHRYNCRAEQNPWRQVSLPYFPNKTLRQNLRLHLFKIITNPSLMQGYPECVYSKWVSQKDFSRWFELARFLNKRHAEKAAPQIQSNPLLKYLKDQGFYPGVVADSFVHWQANCPSGHRHSIDINSDTNEWGCGYCKVKGIGIDIVEKFPKAFKPNHPK